MSLRLCLQGLEYLDVTEADLAALAVLSYWSRTSHSLHFPFHLEAQSSIFPTERNPQPWPIFSLFFTPRLIEGIDPTSGSTFHTSLPSSALYNLTPAPNHCLKSLSLGSTVTKSHSWLFTNLPSWLLQIIVTEKQIWKNLLYYLMWCLHKFVSCETFLHNVLFRSPVKIMGLVWLNWDGTWL